MLFTKLIHRILNFEHYLDQQLVINILPARTIQLSHHLVQVIADLRQVPHQLTI